MPNCLSGTQSWVPSGSDKMEKAISQSLMHQMGQDHMKVTADVVPWYLNQFPAPYFREVGESTRMEHLKGLAALKGISYAQDVSLSLTSVDDEHSLTDITMIRTDAKPGVLVEMLDELQSRSTSSDPLFRVRAFSSFDGTTTLNTFTYGNKHDEKLVATPEDGASQIEYAATPEEKESVKEYLSLCHPAYAKVTTPERFVIHRELYEKVKGTDLVDVRIDPDGRDRHWITIAAANASPEAFLGKVTALCFLIGINIEQLLMDKIMDPSNLVGDQPGVVCVVRIYASPNNSCVRRPSKSQTIYSPDTSNPFNGDFNDLSSTIWTDFQRDLRRIKWLDSTTVDLCFKQCQDLGMERSEIITAFCAMLHGPLSKIDPYAYSRPHLLGMCGDAKNTGFFAAIADLFLARFNPSDPLSSEEFSEKAQALRTHFNSQPDEKVRTLLMKMVDAVAFTLRTNFFVPNRCALALRVGPALMISGDKQKAEKQKPFGVFFIHGQGFDGFHNRFQNIARGGLRLVSPNSVEQHALESSRCYDEVYGLSYAQQLKNKDIPEGGAKAVVLVDLSRTSPGMKYHALRTATKGFVDALLDLIVPVEAVRKQCVDYLGFDEIIYLGPDEQILPEDINWIIKHAAKRGYGLPSAFMSSKPLAGINHKTYGVTSEGVAVFLDVALRNHGINPKEQPFTVKITGGPDGDVGGNLLRILFRDYGDNVKIVGVADGSGCAEDPAGMSHSELLRLFKAGAPIAELDSRSLSKDGKIYTATTEDGAQMRNTMHNRVKADVFVPAGGRPNTMHGGNWKAFLDPQTGAPSSPLIVEGANIFLTPEARSGLHEHGKVSIVKDSSANKCGVITSSYEICASMLLDEAEFLEIKEELVADVLVRLRELARLEAELMFREYKNYPGALPAFSERISQAINRTKAAIWQDLEGMQKGDSIYNELLPLFAQDHLPKKLSEVAGDRVSERIPLDYLRNAFASALASKLLYKEGIHFLEAQPRENLMDLAIRYYREEKRLRQLLQELNAVADLPDAEKHEVLELLSRGGVRSALGVY